MPPRLRAANLPSSTSPSPFSSSCAPSHSIPQPVRSLRAFSHTPCQQVTYRRRKFYEWINGPGEQLKEPLPRATNYLGAYDKYGNLVRARPGWSRENAKQAVEKLEEPAMPSKEVKTDTEADSEKVPEGQEDLDALEAAISEGAAEAKEAVPPAKKQNDDLELPPETAEDLRPFPMNPYFRSQAVLSEELREAIYQRVKRDGATVSLASVEFGVSNERVGAVVRLKQMEKEWIAQGKYMALPYSKAVLGMLPKTPYIDPSKPSNKNKRPIPHEPINDLVVHPATRQQLFVPVAESRHFTRVDAGKAFDNHLLPADARIPHPELVQAERELAQGLPFDERQRLVADRLQKDQARKHAIEQKNQAELRAQRVVPQRRWDFVFRDVSVDAAGRDGRHHKGVGWRYGIPHEDRKRGIIKIPTRIEA